MIIKKVNNIAVIHDTINELKRLRPEYEDISDEDMIIGFLCKLIIDIPFRVNVDERNVLTQLLINNVTDYHGKSDNELIELFFPHLDDKYSEIITKELCTKILENLFWAYPAFGNILITEKEMDALRQMLRQNIDFLKGESDYSMDRFLSGMGLTHAK